ncbi:unnamed protein product [Choristocarpus tenellus]
MIYTVVHALQELGQEKKLPLLMYFIDLQKEYVPVHRFLLRVVLTKFGVSTMSSYVIRRFLDRMRAMIRVDDSEWKEWVEVEQGLR